MKNIFLIFAMHFMTVSNAMESLADDDNFVTVSQDLSAEDIQAKVKQLQWHQESVDKIEVIRNNISYECPTVVGYYQGQGCNLISAIEKGQKEATRNPTVEFTKFKETALGIAGMINKTRCAHMKIRIDSAELRKKYAHI